MQQPQQLIQLSPSKAPNGTLAPVLPAPALIKSKQIIMSQAVVDSVADQPRDYLGDVLYEPKLKAARKYDPLTGRPPRYPYSTTPRPLPLDMIKDKANSILTVKVSKVFLEATPREEITHRRALWGTDIYTDDSDVIAACIHGGWIRGEWPDDVDVELLGLREQADTTGSGGKETTGRKRGAAAAAAAAAAEIARSKPPPDILTAPLKTGPMPIPPEKDLHVTLLVLPTLLKYSATTRFGIRSREWGGQPQEQHQPHDGMSFKVLKIRWVTNGAGAQSRLRGKARRERIRQAMREVEVTPSGKVDGTLGNGLPLLLSGAAGSSGGGPDGFSSQWWRPAPRKPASDGDKENRPGSSESATGKVGTEQRPVAPIAAKDSSNNAVIAQASSNKEITSAGKKDQASEEQAPGEKKGVADTADSEGGNADDKSGEMSSGKPAEVEEVETEKSAAEKEQLAKAAEVLGKAAEIAASETSKGVSETAKGPIVEAVEGNAAGDPDTTMTDAGMEE